MIDREQREAPEQYRLAGEETPMWLAVGFALVGSLLAVAAAWLWMIERPGSQESSFQPHPIHEQARISSAQPDIERPAKPIFLPADTPALTAASRERQDIRPEPRPSLNASADVPASPDDSGETASTKQTAPASSGSAPKPADCPPTLTIPFKRGGVQPIIADDIQGHLERLREWLNRHPEKKLAVEGHTDTKGSERHNLLLSYRRAKAVVGFLNKAGVSERQIAILAAGETAPIEGIPADSDDNRRVILQVEGAENCQDFSTKSEGL